MQHSRKAQASHVTLTPVRVAVIHRGRCHREATADRENHEPKGAKAGTDNFPSGEMFLCGRGHAATLFFWAHHRQQGRSRNTNVQLLSFLQCARVARCMETVKTVHRRTIQTVRLAAAKRKARGGTELSNAMLTISTRRKLGAVASTLCKVVLWPRSSCRPRQEGSQICRGREGLAMKPLSFLCFP